MPNTPFLESMYHPIEKILNEFKNGATYSDSIAKVQDLFLSSSIREEIVKEIRGEIKKHKKGKGFFKIYASDYNEALSDLLSSDILKLP